MDNVVYVRPECPRKFSVCVDIDHHWREEFADDGSRCWFECAHCDAEASCEEIWEREEREEEEEIE